MGARILMLAVILGLPALAPAAGDTPLDRGTLRGLSAVNIVVDKLDPQLDGSGISADAVRARIEDRLRAANIPIDAKRPEFVAVKMTAVRAARGPFALAVSLGAYQPVVLSRDPKLRTATSTWEVQSVVLTDQKQLYRAAMDTIDELANGFVTAYRSVNAK